MEKRVKTAGVALSPFDPLLVLPVRSRYLFVLKRHVESAGLDPEACSAHSLWTGFITQAIRVGRAKHRVKKHSGHEDWETFNLCARGGRDLSGKSCRENRTLTFSDTSLVLNCARPEVERLIAKCRLIMANFTTDTIPQ